MSLNVSIVLYKQSVTQITPLVEILRNSEVVSDIFLIDNSPSFDSNFRKLNAIYIHNDKNLGYGTAHNIALNKSITANSDYHLVVNPDISFDPGILGKIIEFMDKNTDVGHLMPKVYYPTGEIQYLCKLLPTPFDLIFRRFLPSKWTQKRREYFELRASGYDKIMNVPYLSGCFMMLRIEALKNIGIFDEQFFMYPEDIDLTRRIHSKYRTVFYPNVSIIHHHAKSSYLNFKMLMIHTLNMIKYFNKWGWIFDNDRKIINKKIVSAINKTK